MKEYIATVLVRDRVGIIAGVSRAVWELNGNILEFSQTVVCGYFTVIVCAEFSDETKPDAIRDAIAASGSPGEMIVTVRERGSRVATPTVPNAERFILTVLGKDQPGIICRISSCLADNGVNISDLYGKARESGFELVLEVELPPDRDPVKLKAELERVGSSVGLRAHLMHENLFVATNSVRPVRILAGY
jgi:predicted amino acid-binding ACT domain protein